MESFPHAICDFQTTFLKTRIKATEVWLLATSAGHFKYWRYGKMREFRVKLNFAPKNSRTFYPELSRNEWLWTTLCLSHIIFEVIDVLLDLKLPMPITTKVDTTLYDKVCQWLATGCWFSLGTSVSFTNKTDCHDITDLLLKVALNTKHHKPNHIDVLCH
jgi:hypothetical protein